MKYLAILFLIVTGVIAHAENFKFTCSTEVKACEKSDSSAAYPLCKDIEVLLREQITLNCPEGKYTDLKLSKFSFNKKMQIIYSCSDNQTLKIVVNEVITAQVGRVLNLSASPVSTDILQQFSTLIADTPPGDKRILFDLSCLRAN